MSQTFGVLSLMLSLSLTANSAVVEPDKYLGSASCAGCHQQQYQQWINSDHAKSMAGADTASVLGDFNDVQVIFHNIESHFFIRDNVFQITTANAAGARETFPVRYTFGHYPLQQYLVETGDGHIQALNLAWDSRSRAAGGQRWFHLQADENITPRHPFYWTRHFQSWNSRCADCHSTNVDKNYDPKNHAYRTTWSEINVGCEACHGPGKTHLALVQGDTFSAANTGFSATLPRPGQWVFQGTENYAKPTEKVLPDNENDLNMCGGWHSRRASLAKTEPGKPYHDQFHLQTLRPDLYYPDGQILDEVFVFGSFMQSKMHKKGVTCGNCHNPHSGKVLTESNALCTQCHRSETFDDRKHHHHQPASPGGQCVNCHMPATTYMQVDARRDHRFVMPDPGRSEKLGVPNACQHCHSDQTNGWMRSHIERWSPDKDKYATKKPTALENWIAANVRANRFDPLAVRDIEAIARSPALNAIQTATLIGQLSGMPSQAAITLAAEALAHPDALVRRTAVTALQSVPAQTRLSLLLPRLEDPVFSVRVELGRVLSTVNQRVPEDFREKVSAVIGDYRKSLEYAADTPANQAAIAILNLNLGNPDAAERAYRKALQIEPDYIPAMLNLADFYRQQGKESAAGTLLHRAVKVAPDSAMAQHTLGLHLVREKRYTQALPHLQKATELEDTHPRYAFVHAVALDSLGKRDQAIARLIQANQRWPNQYNLLAALIDFMDKQGQLAQAGQYIARLSQLAPASTQVKNWVARYQQLPGS